MTSTGGQLYLWDGQALWAADPTREPDWQTTDGVETDIPFELVTGDVGLDGTEQRYLSRLTLPRRCGSLRLRLRGKGQITLRGLVRTIAPAKGKLWEEDASWQA